MRRLTMLFCLLLLSVPVPVWGQETLACTESADVGWEVDHDTTTVTASIVEVPGCDDGDVVGLQLETDDHGWVPAEPLVTEVVDERARFDLRPLGLGMRPVIGVRVLLYGDDMTEVVEVVVDQRYVNQAGNEQQGLREVTELEVPVGEDYRVPGAPTRYESVPCEDVGIATDNAMREGAGTYTATEAGRHVVCYQQQPGSPGGSPGEDDEPEVLGVEFERPDATDGSPITATTTTTAEVAGGGPLARTGVNLLAGGVLAVALVVFGQWLVRRRRSI